jgi:hypothetical protein
VSKDSDQTETAPNGEQAPMVYPGKEPRASDSVLAAVGMRVTARYSGAADDLRLADEMLAQAHTKQLPSTRTEIGAGGELIDREKVGSHLCGKSTGPRTPEGLERSRRANWKHGHFSREAKAERSRLRAAMRALRDLCDSI